MIKISDEERKILIALLKESSAEFSNHGCNAFDLRPYLTKEQAIDFDKKIHEWNGDPEEAEPENAFYSYDWLLMSYFADLLEKNNDNDDDD